MIKVGVCGAHGRMGGETCRAVAGNPDTELVAAIGSADQASSFAEAGAEVVVDFTVATAARTNLRVLADSGIHAVVGTSGLNDDDITVLRDSFTRSHCLIAPNFAIGAVLMMRFAELSAPFFATAEIIETHHNQKIDAPSGTALQTAQAMAEASTDWLADPTLDMRITGARGARTESGITVHSVRLKGRVAHQEVLLGNDGEMLTIRHDTVDRSAFMPGVILAVKQIVELPPGLTVGLETFVPF